ncbi:hypothetical protein DY000_02040642 [Brassica cretica]|uniref:Uncharacterized protein n=1 Tax=Brassica cretica TaxID=69181 RepID=A0ABQ7B837_BRACR|nr:hypothetical protein DY000_02040642 [Brassica cretica]
MDSSLVVTRRRSFSHSRSDRSLAIVLSQSLRSISRGHSTRSLAVTRHKSLHCSYSSWIALSQLLGADRSLAVARIDISRSLDSLSYSYSAHITLLRLLGTDRSLAVTRHGSLSCSYSARIALSQSLGLLASLEHNVIPRRHVHLCLSIDASSMTTCYGGSEHCLH